MEKKTDIIGYIGLGISAIGAIASVATSNVALASIPLTVGVGCNVFSRKQYNDALVDAYNSQQESIQQLTKKLDEHSTEVRGQLIENHRDFGNSLESAKKSINESIENQSKDFQQQIKKLELQYDSLKDLVKTIEDVENLSQNIAHDENPAQFYYDRGLGYEKLGNKEGAIADYTEAIKLDPTMAKAYHKRGVLLLGKDQRQKAVDDLRKAALLYFENGDIDSYHQAREMSRNVHDLRSSANGHSKQKKMVVGKDLFA